MNTHRLPRHVLGPVALLISLYFHPEPGGGANTALNRALILQKVGYRVYVVCGFPSYPSGRVIEKKYKGKYFFSEKMGDLTIIRLRLLSLESKGYLRRFILFINFNFLMLIWMPRILKISEKVDLVYALAPILFSSSIGFFYSKVTKSFFVYEVSAFWPEELVAIKGKLYFILLYFGKVFAKISYIVPDMIVVISNSAAKYITKKYKPNAQIYPMPIGVDPKRYPIRSKESARRELINKRILPDSDENKFILLYAGVITKVTKVENVFYVANKLKKEQDIIFLVVGEGEEKARLQKYKQDNAIDNLYLLPFQDSALVPYLISAADACIMPLSSEPIYGTTIPTKFFDYLACHKPQIGICAGELAELINSNGIGVTVNDGEIDKLAEKIVTLKNSPLLLDSMVQNSRILLHDFTLDSLAVKFNIAMKECMAIRNKRIR